VNHDFEVCGLGELRGACDELQIFKKGDIYEELLGAFSKLNNPQKHETRTSVDPSKAAQSSVELAMAFIRNWFP
jgi:transcription elongation factor Elf1